MTAGKAPSLTLRLTLLFALASALVLFLLGLLIGDAVEQHFEEQDMELLAGKLTLVRSILERSSGFWPNEAVTHELDVALTGHHGLAVVIQTKNGQTVFSNDTNAFPPTLPVPPSATSEMPAKWVARDGTPMRGIVVAVPTGKAGTVLTVGIATEISHHEHFMAAFRRTLWSFMAAATLAMGLLGWCVAQRGLAPLHAIRQRAAAITAKNLHFRLPSEAIPRELAEVTETLNDMLARLEASFQRLSDYSADLAHELRTPLSNLLTQTQVTLSKTRSAEEYREVMASNAEEFERLSRMISDMLFLAKADNDQIIPNLEAVDLANEVRSLIEYYEILAEEKQLQLSMEGKGCVQGDRLMLRRAIGNLLSNALRHTPVGGRIAIRLDDSEAGSVKLTVSNTGETILEEHLPYLFDRFYRADPSRQHSSDGVGLGLAITHSILRAHGGRASVRSADGVTEFELVLPA